MPQSPLSRSTIHLEARPSGIFLNCGYGIYEGSRRVAKIKFDGGFISNIVGFIDFLGLWDKGYRGRIMTSAGQYRVKRKSRLIKTTTWLMQDKTPIAEARERLIPPVIFLEHDGKEYRFELGESGDYQINVDGARVGYTQVPNSLFSRKVHFFMPKSLPLAKQLLLLWIHLDRFNSD
jgi:hypothetical protein